MSLRDQMESSDHLESAGSEISTIQDEISRVLDAITQKINESSAKVCSEIKEQILSEGKSNGLEITDDDSVWSMKYKTLEYTGDFQDSRKLVIRKKGEQETKVFFVVEVDDKIPERKGIKKSSADIIEQAKESLKTEQDYLLCVKEHLANFDENCIKVKYLLGDNLAWSCFESLDTTRGSDLEPSAKEEKKLPLRGIMLNGDVITVDNLVKLIIG